MAKVIVYKMVKEEIEVADEILQVFTGSVTNEEEHNNWVIADKIIETVAGAKWAEGDVVYVKHPDGSKDEVHYKFGTGIMGIVSEEGEILSAL